MTYPREDEFRTAVAVKLAPMLQALLRADIKVDTTAIQTSIQVIFSCHTMIVTCGFTDASHVAITYDGAPLDGKFQHIHIELDAPAQVTLRLGGCPPVPDLTSVALTLARRLRAAHEAARYTPDWPASR